MLCRHSCVRMNVKTYYQTLFFQVTTNSKNKKNSYSSDFFAVAPEILVTMQNLSFDHTRSPCALFWLRSFLYKKKINHT